MSGITMFKSVVGAIPAAVLPLISMLVTPEAASAGEAKWTLRGGLSWVTPSGSDLAGALPAGTPFRFAAGDGAGLGLELEYRLIPRLGVELAGLAADLAAGFTLAPGGAAQTDTEDAAFELFSIGANYHPTPGRTLDFHVGAFAAISYFDDVIFLTEVGRADKLVFDDDVGLGIKLGLDRPFGASERWLGSLSLRYLSTILEGEVAGQDSDLDPLILLLGVGLRF